MSNVSKISGAAKRSFRQYLMDTVGAISPITALIGFPTAMAIYGSIEMAEISRERQAFQSSVDNAVLAVAGNSLASISGLSESEKQQRIAQLEVLAENFVLSNYDEPNGASIDVSIAITGDAVSINSKLELTTPITSFANLGGFRLGSIDLHSEVKKAMRPIELVMVMDTTGSMSSGGKLAGAKAAAQKLLETLYEGTPSVAPDSEFIRTALVPFSGAVRLDTSHSDFNINWIDTAGNNPLSKLNFDAEVAPAVWNNHYAWSRLMRTSSANHAWNGCVEARARGTTSGVNDYSVNDAPPVVTNPVTQFPAYFAFDAPGTSSNADSTNYGYNYVSLSGTPNQSTGLPSTVTSTSSSSTTAWTTTSMLRKQENYRKYDGRNIGAESTSTSGPWSGCAATKLVPMTYNRAKVEAGITAMQAYGPTLIAEGLAWGLRAISPNQPLTKVEASATQAAGLISPYGDPRWEKIMVLMTDGDNDLGAGGYGHNTTSYSAYGRGAEALANNRFGTTNASEIMTALDTEMLNVCAKIKAAGIDLYVSSFGSGVSTTTKARLKSCATPGDGYYVHAAATTDLVSFFDHIGENVKNKQIYVSK